MRLQDYLDRIGFEGKAEPTLTGLIALHEAHACAVPFENIDVQLGRPVTTVVEDAYEKIVVNKRGGWCFEQNGLFGWALSEIGFDVRRIAGGVMREESDDTVIGNHLCLLVHARDAALPYLSDVGFGGSLLSPIPFVEGTHDRAPFTVGLEQLEHGYWRFWESRGDGRFTYDFLDAPALESALLEKSEFLQTDRSSGFVKSLVAQKRAPDRHTILRGRVLDVSEQGCSESRVLGSPDELLEVLARDFQLDVPEVVSLWPRIVARHQELFGDDASVTNF